MGWLQGLGGMLEQYAGGATGQSESALHEHFDQAAAAAPQSMLTQALAGAFRSDQTPPFSQIAGQLFSNSPGTQQASLLNSLLASAEPAVLAKLAAEVPALGGLLSGGSPAVTPQTASQVPPDVVQQLAEHVESKDNGIVERVSSIYAQHPALIKSLGAAVVGVAMTRLAQHR